MVRVWETFGFITKISVNITQHQDSDGVEYN